jgi:hypothetical protein
LSARAFLAIRSLLRPLARRPRLPLGVHHREGAGGGRGDVSSRGGGTRIEDVDEDPRVRRDGEAELAQRGISCQMPAVNYR